MAKVELAPSSALFPVPSVMVSSATAQARPNVITLAWVGTVCSQPPLVAISVRPSRHSHALIAQSREFVINIPSEEQAVQMDYCGQVSGRDVDKFARCGFTPREASRLQYAPLIAECPVNLECQVRQIQELGSHDLFIAEVVAVHADREILGENQRINHQAVKPLCYVGNSYYGLGNNLGRAGIGRALRE